MTDHVVVSVQEEDLFVVVREQDRTQSTTNLYNPVIVDRVANIGDVDTSILQNGSVLVYKTDTRKWTSTVNLDLQIMEGGEY